MKNNMGASAKDRACKKCGQIKPITEFAKQGFNADGTRRFRHTCRSCRKEYKRQWDKTTNAPSTRIDYIRGKVAAWKAENPGRVAARKRFERAVAAGEIQKQPCCRCGSVDNVDATMPDARNWRAIVWLCRSCHLAALGDEREASGEALSAYITKERARLRRIEQVQARVLGRKQ